MKRFLISLVLILASVSFSLAQNNAVFTAPTPIIISPIAKTIVSSSAFQLLFAAPPSTPTSQTGRQECLIQNLSVRDMFIFFDVPTNAITSNSFKLAAGLTFRCSSGGTVIRNAISIGGTATDQFFAAQ